MPIRKVRIDTMQFPDRKRGFFCSGKKLLLAKVDSEGCPTGETYGRVKTKGLRGGIPEYVAQASLQVDTARATIQPHRIGPQGLPFRVRPTDESKKTVSGWKLLSK